MPLAAIRSLRRPCPAALSGGPRPPYFRNFPYFRSFRVTFQVIARAEPRPASAATATEADL